MERLLWDRIQEIYHSTVPMSPSERGAFVATACNSDPFLVREVSSLLEAEESSHGFLESPVFEIGLKIISSRNRNGLHGTGVSTADCLVGTTIGQHYLVEKRLGHGGMGCVYLARDLTLHNRPVVIKVLLQASLQDPYVVKKFRQEVEALSRIDHPGVVGVLGAGELSDGKPYIVMQYVSGETLRSQIPSEGMDLQRTALLLQQIGAALEDVHKKGIFHRDLKPDNIMLQVLTGGTELVKVVDFGIAKVKDSVVAPSTVNNVPVGSVLYMSPEQLRGEKVTAASDIYSMAVIAYEMVTGRRPFNPTSAPQLLEMHREGVRVRPTDLRASLPTEAQAVILRGLSFERTTRYQSATEFGNALAGALVEEREIQINGYTRHSLRRPNCKTQPNPPLPIPSIDNSGPSGEVMRWGKRKLSVIGAALPLLVLVVVSIMKSTGIGLSGAPELSPTRSMSYSLTVQKMRDDKPFNEPFESSGQEIYENGYKFRLNVSSPDGGHIYLFNDGPPTTTGTSFTIIYPTPETSGGSAAVSPNQLVRTNWNKFAGDPGTEHFWMVWSATPVPELESAKAEAFEHPDGALTGDTLIRVREFLKRKQVEIKERTTKDKNNELSTVRATSDMLVKLVELVHR